MKRIVAACFCVAAIVCGACLVGCGSSSSTAGAPAAGDVSEPAAEAQQPADDCITFGSTFEFDDKSITLGNEYFTTTLDNQFDDHNGETVIGVPVSATNIGDETGQVNMFTIKEYGSAGTELDSVYYYFDDDVRSMGEMRPGATLEGNLYFLYDGNGDYYLEFGYFNTDVEVKLPVEL